MKVDVGTEAGAVSLAGEMVELLQKLRASKGEDRSEKARRIAVTITEFEKVLAYYHAYVVEEWTV